MLWHVTSVAKRQRFGCCTYNDRIKEVSGKKEMMCRSKSPFEIMPELKDTGPPL
jgi:hypothetical protein